jgi:hypothetical protein
MYNLGTVVNPMAFTAWYFIPNLFSADECDSILALAPSPPDEWTPANFVTPEGGFASVNVHSVFANDHQWIFDRLATAAIEANSKNWNLQIEGFFEDAYLMQFLEGSFEPWRYGFSLAKGGRSLGALRKLVIDVQLTDPTTYGGCDFRPYGFDWDGWEERKARGSAIIRPAFFMTETSECYDGTRNILRSFVHGQHFR